MRNFDNKISVDYQALNEKVNRKFFLYSDVKNRLQKIAFDVVKFNDDEIEGLWKIETSPEGEVIVALYDENIQKSAEKNTNWKILTDKNKEVLSFFYKNQPITKIASSNLNIPTEEVDAVISFLPERLSKNSSLRKKLLKTSNYSDLNEKFPELFEDK